MFCTLNQLNKPFHLVGSHYSLATHAPTISRSSALSGLLADDRVPWRANPASNRLTSKVKMYFSEAFHLPVEGPCFTDDPHPVADPHPTALYLPVEGQCFTDDPHPMDIQWLTTSNGFTDNWVHELLVVADDLHM